MEYLTPILLGSVATVIVALLVYAVAAMLYRFSQRLRRSIANRLSPQKTYHAVVVGKREELSSIYPAFGYGQYVETEYYITFEFRTGDRREYYVDGSDYGLVREGDEGVLTVQGTWFCDFERQG
jgi:hypothetical protein